jgi:hypothetical protein
MSINVRTGQPSCSVALGIYAQSVANNNLPGNLLLDAGSVSVARAGVATIGSLTASLSANTRYWAVLMTDDNTGGGLTIDGIPQSSMIFWGATPGASSITPVTFWQRSVTAFGALPDPFPTLAASNIQTGVAPTIALALGFFA